ncbi:MAG: hypothetical protein ACMUHB_03685 [Thermoplasmatota archaeon]
MSRYLSETDLTIMKMVAVKSERPSSLAGDIGVTLSTVSLSISHMVEIGLLKCTRSGRARYVGLQENEMGNKLKTFIIGNRNIDIVELFKGNGLLMLISMSGTGSTMIEIQVQTGLTRSTIIKYLKKWRRMGIIWKAGHGGRYTISSNYPDLEVFLSLYSRYRLLEDLQKDLDDHLILFNDEEMVIFACEDTIDQKKYKPAAYSHLASMGYDVVADKEYYLYRRSGKRIGDTEAVIQAMRIDTLNPRPRRLLRKMIIEGKTDGSELSRLSERYGIEEIVDNEVKRIEGKKEVQYR